MAETRTFEAPEIAAAFQFWQESGHFHPLTCGGGGGPCSGVSLVVRAANPHAVMLVCPDCDFEQFEYGTGLFDNVVSAYEAHDEKNCWLCEARAARDKGNARSGRVSATNDGGETYGENNGD